MAAQGRATTEELSRAGIAGRLVPAGVDVLDEWDVRRYLHEHPFAVRLVEEAVAQIRARFESEVVLTLRVTHYEEGDDKLSLRVYTTLSLESARKRLEAFDNEWWLGQESAAFTHLVVTVTGR